MRCRRCRSAHRAARIVRRSSRARAFVVTGLLAAAAANVAFAQTLDPHATTLSNAFGAGPLLVLPTVNGGRRDVALITRDADGRYYADDATLADWRILPPYPAAVDIGGRSLRPLDGLPGLEVRLDERNMTADIVVPTPLMLGTRRSLGCVQHREIDYRHRDGPGGSKTLHRLATLVREPSPQHLVSAE